MERIESSILFVVSASYLISYNTLKFLKNDTTLNPKLDLTVLMKNKFSDVFIYISLPGHNRWNKLKSSLQLLQVPRHIGIDHILKDYIYLVLRQHSKCDVVELNVPPPLKKDQIYGYGIC